MQLFKTPYRLLALSLVFGLFLICTFVFVLLNIRPPVRSVIINSRVESKKDSADHQMLYLDRNIEQLMDQGSSLFSNSFVWQGKTFSSFAYKQNIVYFSHGPRINKGDTLAFRLYPVSRDSLLEILLKRNF